MAVLILDVTGVLAVLGDVAVAQTSSPVMDQYINREANLLADAFIDVLENTLQLTELALSTANIRAGFRISG